MRRDKQAQRASLSKEAVRVDRLSDGVDLAASARGQRCEGSEPVSYHFALERPPDDGAVAHGELGEATPGENAALGNIERIHDGDDVVVARACPLDIFDQLCRDELVHVPPKVGRVQRDAPLEVV